MKAAIVALTRGYPDNKSSYDNLLNRNQCIYENINNLRPSPLDMILFHEGNISIDDQNYINSYSAQEIKFIDVSKYFVNPGLKLEGEKKFNLGYRQMCRFNMYHIWDEVKDYSHILRVDEDIEILKFDPYVFEFMDKRNITYMTGRFTKDIHRLTNRTLPEFIINNTDMNINKVYNHKNPYTNVFATSVNFWRSEEVSQILKNISLADQQLINRWGDHTVHGIMLNHMRKKINLFTKLEYKHISHSNLIIQNNLIRNYTINSKYNPVSIKEGFYTKIKIKLKAKIKPGNKFDFENN